MKKGLLFCAAVIMMAGCSIENDMMIPRDVSGYEFFEIEGQLSSSINTAKLTVSVTMPYGVSLDQLEISKIKYTDATKFQETLMSRGSILDLRDTNRVTLHAFRDFTWKLIASNAGKDDPKPGSEPQLYNMNFDDWSMAGKGWYPFGESVPDADKKIWATANRGTASLGRNTTEPEETFVAVPGPGKKAAKLSSQYIVMKFGSGNIFTGEFCKLIGMSGADMAWGVPFTGRPKSLHGYFCYQPKTIDYADDSHKSMLGKTDVGQIQIILADWDKNKWSNYPAGAIDEQGRFHVINSANQFVDYDNDPAIIGYANFEFSNWMDAYEEFDIPITYRSDRTPTMVAIVVASSRHGDFFTGAAGTVLYLDEFSFKY